MVRIAIVSDIHGNLTAFEAILSDLRDTAPDLVFHGGDLSHGGSSPVEIVDRISSLGWPGVLGNTDQILFHPASLTTFIPMRDAIAEMAAFTQDQLGEHRLNWLRQLPPAAALPVAMTQSVGGNITLTHATLSNAWQAPGHNAPDSELDAAYPSTTVYGHIHVPFVRTLTNKTVINSGAAGLPYDADQRASYLILDNGRPTIRRVPYDLEKELRALQNSKLPFQDWTRKMLLSAAPVPL